MEEIMSSVPAVLARWLGVTDKTVRELAKLCAWACLANRSAFQTSGLFANGASLSFIFGHRLSTIPRPFFLLETFFGPLSGLI
jgi:hypothetical protein